MQLFSKHGSAFPLSSPPNPFYCVSAGLIHSLAFHLLKVRAQTTAALSHPLECDERESEANPATVTFHQCAFLTRLILPQSEDIQTCSVIIMRLDVSTTALLLCFSAKDVKPRQHTTPALCNV